MTQRKLGKARAVRRLRRAGLALTLTSLPVAMSLVLGPGDPAALGSTAPHPRWLIDSHAISLLRGAGASSSLLNEAFGGSHAYVAGTPGGLGTPTATYYSYTAIKKAFADGALPGKYRAVLLDMEHWKFTPDTEQKSPAKYEELTAKLVHKHKADGHRMLLIDAPAADLVQARCKCSGDVARKQFLAWDIAGGAARYADVIDIQAQNDERDLSSYRQFVDKAAGQARSAHPAIVVLAGLSTDNGPHQVGGGALDRAYTEVRGTVAGYWLNIPSRSAQCPKCAPANPKAALSLLKSIYG